MVNVDGLILDVKKIIDDDSSNTTTVELSDLAKPAYDSLRLKFRDKGYDVIGIVNILRVDSLDHKYTLHISRGVQHA